MRMVTLHHPDLPGQPIEVPESAVPHHLASGWSDTETAEQPPAPATAQPAVAPAEAKPTTSPALRRGDTSSKES